MLRRRLPWIALLAALAAVVVFVVAASSPEQTPEARAKRLEKELKCPTCQGLSVADSHEESSEAIREDIQRRIDAGQSDAEIRRAYVAVYGEQILLDPDSGGLGVLVWGLPAVVVILGAAGVTYAVRRSRREPRIGVPVGGDPEAMQAELEFLRRSLADLDAEHAIGELDDETHARLRAQYTDGVEAVTAALAGAAPTRSESEPEPEPTGDASGRTRRPTALRHALTVAGVVCFAVAAALVLTSAIGERTPGSTATGNDAVSYEQRKANFAANVKARPDDYATRIAYARFLLNDDRLEALKQYDKAAELDPSQPEPKAYGGWILGLSAQSVGNADDRKMLLDGALARLDAALELDEDYAEAYVFKGLVLYQVLGDAEQAIPYLQRYLQLVPEDDSMREVVLGALAQAAQDAPSSTTVPETNPAP